MKKVTTSSLFFLTFFCFSLLNAQVSKEEHLLGTPCKNCPADPQNQTQKNDPNQVQNGNGTVNTSYTVSACGLNFTTASQRLHKRAFTGMSPQTGVNQPASFAISGIP